MRAVSWLLFPQKTGYPRSGGIVGFGGQVITYVNLQAPSHGEVVQHATCTDGLAHEVWGIQQGTPRLIQASERDFRRPKVRSTPPRVLMCAALYLSSPGVWGFQNRVMKWGPSAYAESPGREKTGGC